MKVDELLQALLEQGITLWADGDQLAVDAPSGVIAPELRQQLVAHKPALLALLRQQREPRNAPLPPIVHRPEERYEPFPMTEIQQAYCVGRNAEFELSAAMHAYNEIDCRDLDVARLEHAWNQVVDRREMLRAVALPGFQQRILQSVPRYRIPVEDLRDRDPEAIEARLRTIRERLTHQVFPLDRWPTFELRVCRLDGGRSRLFMSIDGTFIDGYSFQILYRELVHFYKQPDVLPEPAVLELSFRDYALTVHGLRDGVNYQRSLAYWRERLKTLPPAPDLPLERDPSTLKRPRFQRWLDRIDIEVWQRLKTRARARGLTEPELLLAAYAEILARWSRSPRFTINVPHFNRLPLHPQITDVVGTFASFTLVEVDHRAERSFTARALAIREQLLLALEHREISGVELLRELFKAQGRISGAIMPVVLTSFASHLGAGDSHWVDFLAREFGELVCALTQTPQVWIDHQIVYQSDGVFLNWDVAAELFPPGMIDAMFGTYVDLLRRLADDDLAWDAPYLDTMPPAQRALLAGVNATERPLSGDLLHAGFYRQAAVCPDARALVMRDVALTYRELARRANRLGHALRAAGAGRGGVVAIVMEKGWEQIVAAIGVLASGAAYLPIDAALPAERRFYMMENGGAKLVVTQPKFAGQPLPPGARALVVTEDAFGDASDAPLAPSQGPEDLAHILYTSGSTGLPNGAMLTHQGMVNAIEWTNRRFGIGADDRVIALSALHHDFSVYDIFGTLSAGATIVMPDAETRRDPSHWAELMSREGVTVWSTVPAMMEMLLTHLEGGGARVGCPLRLAMFGGDWVPVTMPARVRAQFGDDVQVVSVGGPTETSLWNITHPVARDDEKRRSIPYGKPIANTKYYVLDEQLEERPIGVPGELCCAGVGVARGYVGAGARTAKFTVLPRTGERIYRTGDLGRYLPDGSIEFLGRVDFQLSIRGQRIEPGEIEAALLLEPSVRAAVVGAVGEHHDKKLVAYVVAADPGAGIDVPRLREFLARKLPEHMVPAVIRILDALPLTANAKVDRRALPSLDEAVGAVVRGAPSSVRAPGAEARSIEERVGTIVQQVLGLAEVHPDRNFFELGANSIHLVQLHAKLGEAFGIKIPLVELFGNPTVRFLAQHVGSRTKASLPPEQKQNEAKLAPRSGEGRPTELATRSGEGRAAGLAPRSDDARPMESALPAGDDRDIAIIGMSCRMPGAPNVERFWENLVGGVESITTFTDEELLAAGVSPSSFADPDYVRASAVLEDYDQFDAGFFSLSEREARKLDPQQRLFLECAWEALESAGYRTADCGETTGVYAGKSVSHYRYPYPDLTKPIEFFQDLVSQDKDFLATQVSYKLDLRGPSVNVHTACSTSLVAILQATEALLQGSCDMALAGGVALKVPHRVGYRYEEGSVFSKDGHCRPFDAKASGTIPGSGVGVLVLKRLRNALADGDTVLAVIKGGAINNDGHRKVGFMAPGVDGQAAVIAKAHRTAGVDAPSISYIEAHGTGTAIGDPIEAAALARVFGRSSAPGSCAVGSVKSNIGHLDSAAGVASVIKVVLALQHRTLPPSLNFQALNPQVDFEGTPFYVVHQPTPWTSAGAPRRAGISSFGIGGTNAHLVLEEAPEPARPLHASHAPHAPHAYHDADHPERSHHVLALSARSDAALRQLAGRYRERLEEPGASLPDICFSANTGRAAFEHRLGVIAPDPLRAAELLGAAERGEEHIALVRAQTDAKRAPKVAFLFSGQGSKMVGAARELYETHPGFRRRIDGFDALLRDHWDRSLISVLYPEPGQHPPIDQLDYAQPALFALEYALAELWISWGIVPDALVGHSTGELAAACIAGVFSVEDGLKLVAHRGRLLHQLAPPGSNIAVFAPEADLRRMADEGGWEIFIASINGPDNHVVSGRPEIIDAYARALEKSGLKVRRLNIARAAHSALMDPVLPELLAVASTISFSRPAIRLVSGMTGEAITDEVATPEYWCRQLRRTVRFGDCVSTLHRDGVQVFVEIGPEATLLGMAARCVPENYGTFVPSARPDDGGWQQLAESAAQLFVRGLPLDWAAFDAGYRRTKVPVPTYPFQRQRYWEENAGLQRATGVATSLRAGHPLLGVSLGLSVLASGDIVFESTLGPGEPAFVAHHRLEGVPTLPATAFAEMALAAGAHVFGSTALVVRDLALLSAMSFPGDTKRTVQCAVSRAGAAELAIRIFSRPAGDVEGAWTLHATAAMAPHDAGDTPAPEYARIASRFAGAAGASDALHASDTTAAAYYARAEDCGVGFGPSFRGIVALRRRDDEVLARVERPASLDVHERYVAHPALLDAFLQAVGGVYPSTDIAELYVPVRIERLVTLDRIDTGGFGHAVVRPVDPARNRLRADVAIFGPDGDLRAHVQGLELQRTDPIALNEGTAASFDDWLYERTWEPRPIETDRRSTARSQEPCVIFADQAGLGRKLAQTLERQGRPCYLVTRAAVRGAPSRRIDAWTFEFPRAISDEPAALAEALRDLGLPAACSDVVYLWALDGPPSAELDADAMHHAALEAAGGALGVIHHMIDRSYAGGLWLVTRGAQPVEPAATALASPSSPRRARPSPLAGIAQAPLWGMAQSIAIELTEIDCRCIDLDPADTEQGQLASLTQELRQRLVSDEDRVAFRGERFVARLRKAEARGIPIAPPSERAAIVRPDRSYVIAGGLGRLGLLTATLLALRGARRILLIARSTPDPAAEARLASLRALGVRIDHHRVDIADREALAALFRTIERDGAPVAGVFHTAGVIDDATLRQQTRARFDALFRAKVTGAWNLHLSTAGYALDHFVLFSSVASLLGSAGQANHCAGAAFLDALAHHRRAMGLAAMSINWGVWAGAEGAKVDVTERARTRGFGAIPRQHGVRALAFLLGTEAVQMGVLPIDWRAFAGDAPAPYIADLVRAKSTGEVSVRATFLAKLEATEPPMRRKALVDYVREQVAWMRGLASSEAVDLQQGFTDMGIDSLAALQLKNRLQAGLGITLPATLVFNYPTTEKLSDRLMTDFIPLDFTAAAPVASLDALSEGEIAALLTEQLAFMEES
ncbi:amino acid adenylation domain-containing protein [Pendulispora albinea]|uniref:Amino acid adenylation domain-containing protein n=1 Tax=Pendulispora albinea TaxID=2741071 RepID=A0ABZ2M3I7_9BACT